MAAKTSSVAGFTKLSDQVYFRDGDLQKDAGENDPDVVIIYGWGDCLPQHLLKYAEGYRELFPCAKQVFVLSPIAKAMFTSLEQRSSFMLPILQNVFPDGPQDAPPKILVHAMSNTGAIFFAATLNEYVRQYHTPMPHAFFVMDSTPGGTNLTWSNLKRWSLAMSLGTAKWFPWPFFFTQSIWGFFLLLNSLYLWLRRKQHAGAWSRVAANNEKYAVKEAPRLYMYSKEDDLIGYADIEEHAVEATTKGYQVSTKVFSGSGHVGHMRMHPEEYWASIEKSWRSAV